MVGVYWEGLGVVEIVGFTTGCGDGRVSDGDDTILVGLCVGARLGRAVMANVGCDVGGRLRVVGRGVGLAEGIEVGG